MRSTAFAIALAAILAPCALAPSASAKPTAQSAHCAASATEHRLKGAKRTAFIKSCMRGPLAPAHPTGPTQSSKEAQAITKPSGVDRTVRAKQCADEADRKGLASKDRKAFQLSCQATAGPVSEGETGTKAPHPAEQIKGIGVNNYKPGAAPAKSEPSHNPR